MCPSPPVPPLSRETISRAALAILDEYGFADVTMRRVSSALGVAPGALYWHVKNKQDLISAIATLIVAPLHTSADRMGAADLCRLLRETLLSHRDGAEVVMSAMSQPGSAVAEDLTRLMRAALQRELDGAGQGASSRDVRAVADGLVFMTLGATTVHQSAAQLAEATGTRAGDGDADVDAIDAAGTNVTTAVTLLIDAAHRRNT